MLSKNEFHLAFLSIKKCWVHISRKNVIIGDCFKFNSRNIIYGSKLMIRKLVLPLWFRKLNELKLLTINGSCKVIKVLLLFTYVLWLQFFVEHFGSIWYYFDITCYYESHSMLNSQYVHKFTFIFILAADILSFKFYALFIFQNLHSWEIFYVLLFKVH